ncbi:MAG: VOC family protein [Bacteroidota bacterium]|nr:VOC family protein [Bacteroidota bacterium]
MDNIVISGIQQVGVGVANMPEAWKWYRRYFGMDICIFEEEAQAKLMLPYTGGEPRSRHAALALNMQGGGGFEIWQYKGRTPEAPEHPIKLGDYGIFAAKIKCRNVKQIYDYYISEGLKVTTLTKDPQGMDTFFVIDPYNNYFQLVSANDWFKDENKLTGAAYGALIGVSNIEKSKTFYKEILGYDEVVYDTTDVFSDLTDIPGGKHLFRRILLKHSKPRIGAFSPILGNSQVELFEVADRDANSVFENRFWGDLGFIHLCFDINGMSELREKCKTFGCPFTVDSSNVFDMGEAAGHFSYIEDPDGTLIEFVETHKVPIMKKFGWYLNLQKRDPRKALPRWMLKALSFNRVKD